MVTGFEIKYIRMYFAISDCCANPASENSGVSLVLSVRTGRLSAPPTRNETELVRETPKTRDGEECRVTDSDRSVVKLSGLITFAVDYNLCNGLGDCLDKGYFWMQSAVYADNGRAWCS